MPYFLQFIFTFWLLEVAYLGFYLALGFIILLNFSNKKRTGLKLLTLLIVLVAMFATYKTVPSLKSKIDYTIYSLKIYSSGHEDVGMYSDSRRLISYEAAINIIKGHPVLGVGIGDVQDEMKAFYASNHPEMEGIYVHPHNQYLFTATAIGILGAIFLFFFNIALIIKHFNQRNWLLVAFNLILITSFLVEDTLEMQIGVNIYFLFNYLGWKSNQEANHAVQI